MNRKKSVRSFGLLLCSLSILLLASVVSGLAQDIMTKGSISGTVVDSSGAVVPGAQVSATGEIAKRSTATDDSGRFEFPDLLPGSYVVKAELSGFKTVTVGDVIVNVGKTTALRLTMQVGNISEVIEVQAGTQAVDLSSTAASENLNDQLFLNLPLQRTVTSLFYLAPGVSEGVVSAAGGRANPSVSGGSALDNLYVADGVNITDSAFGGFGIFSRTYGSLGVGITTSYVEEVQVKTGGFEPQYGQAEGGIVNIITKSGTDKYHGEVFGYAQPKSFEALRNQRDDYAVNKVGKVLHPENYDSGVDVGGPIPGLGKRLFFFGSFNPTINRTIVQGSDGSGLQTLLGTTAMRSYSKNYAAKIDANISSKHQVNLSIFGDPTTSNNAPWDIIGLTSIDNLTANSILDYGTRNMAARYSGNLSKDWTVNSSFSWGHNHFSESGYDNINEIIDRTQAARGNFTAVGRGFVEPTKNDTYRTAFDTQKIANFLGTHTFAVGYSYQRAYYSGLRDYSGPHYVVPATNTDGSYNISPKAVGQPLTAEWYLRLAPSDGSCTLCPLMNVPGIGMTGIYLQQARGEFGIPAFQTRSNYHSAYLQDTWRWNKYISFLAGYRWEIEQLVGSPGPSGKINHYTFTDNWSPRFGVTVDPLGRGTTKVYYNFGRFSEYFPLDAAERSLSAELDFIGGVFAPDYTVQNGQRIATINQYGTVSPVVDAAHLISKAAGGIAKAVSVSAQDATNPILPGTKLGYAQEQMIGFEQQLPHGLVLSVRYMDRRLQRIIEDAAVDPPEDGAFLGAFGQTYFIGNINSKTDAAVNPIEYTYGLNAPMPAACDPSLAATAYDRNNNPLGNFCFAANGKNGKPAGSPGADGVPDGFADPVHIYRAVEIEVNKRFSNNWQMLANWRIGSLHGNYEGHYRNDNGQTDPGISSLFDFTQGDFGLLGDQFAVGPLNTDRRHVVNVYTNYALTTSVLPDRWRFLNGLNLGTGFHIESGLPMSNLAAHPVYLNAGEVPLGGRGVLGRTPSDLRIDLHADFPMKISERVKVGFIADVFNITNAQTLRTINQFSESAFQQPNPDFKQPTSWYNPISVRLGMKLSF
ncbi:MAG TPA: carboxypeptidase regulatory-like domain-containing protein [Acidobacteriota bacterium]|nr:carboxypeptidase regulatory-like domain-containing protein [Acidobacteriota bacterium]